MKALGELVKALIDTADTPGGHILICLFLLLAYSYINGSTSHDISVFAIGVLSRSMGTTKT